jgi:hypothetical protein
MYSRWPYQLLPETHIQRQAALHDCLPGCRMLETNKIVYGEEKNYLYWADQNSPGRKKSLFYRHGKSNEPTKEGPPSLDPLSPIHHSFNSQQGPPLSDLSGCYIIELPFVRSRRKWIRCLVWWKNKRKSSCFIINMNSRERLVIGNLTIT